ncbi:PAS domain S-box-containing protein/diguanylate cyclase (GGDEF) domain-containing protein [Allochromatium warmingii]|uniref:PAS domain S-box-containing protein/diguanylate cyclase (GGDEF) domain-containing protein n=2 Tax=Allochromatium warmingii TaxID=61595 RepID=A0A1H3BNW4_ALLWA|nr:PAS domain S-box-containing protein/diguanylate cyclase (GGDEF) domain-containing protein [Allochromatium warmingii]
MRLVLLATVIMCLSVVVAFEYRELLHETKRLRTQDLQQHQQRLEARVRVAIAYARHQFAWEQQTAGAEVDAATVIARTQARILAWLDALRFEDGSYIFIGRYDGLSLAGPAKGQNVLELIDADGQPIVRTLIAYAQAGGGFLEYKMPKLPDQRSAPKLSYVAPIPEWGWYVGTGTFIDDIEAEITALHHQVHQRIQSEVLTISGLFVVILGLAGWRARRIAAAVRRDSETCVHYLEQALDTSAPSSDTEHLPEQLHFHELRAIAQAARRMIAHRRQAEQALRESEQRFRTLVEVSQYYIQELDASGRIEYANPAAVQLFGREPSELIGQSVATLLPEDEGARLLADLHRFATEQPPPMTYYNRNLTADGQMIHVEVDWNYKRDAAGQVIGFVSISKDVTDYRRARLLLKGRNRVLEMLARGQPLREMLTAIITYIEDIAPRAICSIHLLDPATQTLSTAAALSLPEFYAEAVEGAKIGVGIGSCGAAAATGQRVVVADVLTHPDWAAYRELMERTPLRACWSQPIIGHGDQVLGTFAIYANCVMEPSAVDLEMIESAAELAAIVIEHERAASATRQAEEKARLLLESTTEGIFGLDLEGRVTFINPAAADLLGYAPEELIGQSIHPLIHHSHADGTPVVPECCSIFATLSNGQDCHAANEVLWRRDGSSFPAEYWATPMRRDQQIEGAVVTFHDISARKRAEAEIQHLAFHDSLTGLPNRLLFKEELAQALAGLRRNNQRFALHMLDLDHFKDVNDTLGHPVGDQLLRAVTERLTAIIRGTDILARFGGDEFALLQVQIEEIGDAAALASKIIESLEQDFQLGDNRITINTSIGILIADQHCHDVDELITRADVALYKAKEAGRGVHAFFEDSMTQQLRREMEITRELTHAIQANELFVVYQPQFDLHTGQLVGMEALVRWQHPQDGIRLPGAFLTVAEKRGLVRPLSDWVLDAVCRQMCDWSARGLVFGRIAVNLCAQQVGDPDFGDNILAVIERTGANPHNLELEFTETVLIAADAQTQADIVRLSELGIHFAIDDFGTGFSSMQYLRKFRTDKIKIDREFIQDVTHDAGDAEIVKATIALGTALGLMTIAEGVETEEQAEFLRRHGCRQVQGYLYGRPQSVAEIERLLSSVSSDARLT